MSVQRVFPEGIPKAIGPYSPVTSVGNLIFVSGQIPINPQTNNIDANDIEGQTHQVMKNLLKALQGVGCNFSCVTKTTVLLTDMGNFPKVNQVYGSYFEKDQYPARVCYAVQALPKGSLVEIDAIAVKKHEHCQHQHKHEHHEHKHEHGHHQHKHQHCEHKHEQSQQKKEQTK